MAEVKHRILFQTLHTVWSKHTVTSVYFRTVTQILSFWLCIPQNEIKNVSAPFIQGFGQKYWKNYVGICIHMPFILVAQKHLDKPI